VRLAVGVLLVLAAVAAGWPARDLICRLAVPAEPYEPDTSASAAEPAGDAAASGAVTAPDDDATETTGRPHWLTVGFCAAVLLAGLTARIGPGFVLAAYCWLAVATVPLAWIDALVHRLPDVLTGAAYAGTVLLLLAAAAHGGDWGDLLRGVAGGLATAAAYLVVVFIRPAGIGLGDVKLSASLGTALAWTGWGALLAGTLAGFVLAACYGVVLLASHRATLKQQIPLGPFLIAGTFLALLVLGDGSHLH
jgi:prepilin signal peptidase PulO-like enzyme (type II secretory pathway)